LDYEDMPALDIYITIVGITIQTVQNTGSDLSLEFYIEEKVDDRELSNFWTKKT
ncbi:26738_t:CDS:1, partial [Dentiscutata erythropus]